MDRLFWRAAAASADIDLLSNSARKAPLCNRIVAAQSTLLQ